MQAPHFQSLGSSPLTTTVSLIDIHAHLDMLTESAEETLGLCREVGIGPIITVGTEPKDHNIVLQLAQQYPHQIFCTLGVHPHQASLYESHNCNTFLLNNLSHPGVVAVGEIGLDYHYMQSPKEDQLKVFRQQMQLAKTQDLPVQIHTREASADTLAILSDPEFKGQVTGVIHCFTGNRALASACLDLGYNISISGIVTFKNAEEIRSVCTLVPLDRLHVETDSPFLSPVPLRGTPNKPSHLVHTAKFVAQLRGISYEQLVLAVNENARQLFPKLF